MLAFVCRHFREELGAEDADVFRGVQEGSPLAIYTLEVADLVSHVIGGS